MQIRLIVTGLILALTTMTSGAAEAQRPQSLGVFTDWQAFQAVEGNGQLVCFIASKPTNSQGDYTRRGPIWLLVAHRPGGPDKSRQHGSRLFIQTRREPGRNNRF